MTVLCWLLERLFKASLCMKLNGRKCHFFKEETESLGKLVRGSGVSISANLVFMNYHRIPIMDFAHVSADLCALVHAEFFNWTSRHQACFDKLKDLAISAPVLCLPSPDRSFILDTDTTSGT